VRPSGTLGNWLNAAMALSDGSDICSHDAVSFIICGITYSYFGKIVYQSTPFVVSLSKNAVRGELVEKRRSW
jgi:hypothetical protein